MSSNRIAVLALLVTAALVPSVASADDERPEHRVDVVGPSVGLGHFAVPRSDYSRGFLLLTADVRYAHASGHGVMLRGAYGTNVWAEGFGVELDYLFRVVFAGHRDLSFGMDLTIGGSAVELQHDEQTIARGGHFGGNAGVSLDLRAYNFVLSLGGQYRLLAPTGDRIDGAPAGLVHIVTGTLGAGFTFY